MSDKVAWGVFKGLFAFFILLPIGGCIAVIILGGGLASFEAAREQAQRNAAMEASNTVFNANTARNTELENNKRHEEGLFYATNQHSLQQAAVEQQEALRIEKQKQAEALFEYRKAQALKGSASASFDLGLMLLHGEGTETNVELGLKYITIAANGGYGSAIEFLKNQKH